MVLAWAKCLSLGDFATMCIDFEREGCEAWKSTIFHIIMLLKPSSLESMCI